jgi:hypothetical protein
MQRTMATAPAAVLALRAHTRVASSPLALPRSRGAAPARGAVRTFASQAEAVKTAIAASPVVVFSKTYCP